MSERKICPVCGEVYWDYGEHSLLASCCGSCGWGYKRYQPPSGFDYHHERESDDVERINDEIVYEHTHEY